MPKRRKRQNANRSNYTFSPLTENSGQRSAFPEVVAQSSPRDSEWRYDDEVECEDPEESMENLDEAYEEDDDLVGQTFSFNQLDFGEEEEEYEEEEEEGSSDERPPRAVIGEVEDDEWEVEPQTEALAYLQNVRNE